jgi:hypothetical protein
MKMDREWRGLVHSPVDQNDDLMLELSRSWEPLDNPRTLPKGEGEVP